MKAIFYDWGGLNVWLFHLINRFHNAPLDQLMLWGTALGEHSHFPVYLAVLGVVGVTVAGRNPQRPTLPWLIAIGVFAVAFNLDGWLLDWLKPYLDFPRPPLALPSGTVHVVGVVQLHHSLPSGHSSFAMLCAASVWPLLSRPGRSLAAILVIWVGLSRVSLGAHFPADVLAGFISSLLLVWISRSLFRHLMER
jgi:membrane-associated phospholipid phosphatase